MTEHKLEINTSQKYVRIGSISTYDYQIVLIAFPQHYLELHATHYITQTKNL